MSLFTLLMAEDIFEAFPDKDPADLVLELVDGNFEMIFCERHGGYVRAGIAVDDSTVPTLRTRDFSAAYGETNTERLQAHGLLIRSVAILPPGVNAIVDGYAIEDQILNGAITTESLVLLDRLLTPMERAWVAGAEQPIGCDGLSLDGFLMAPPEQRLLTIGNMAISKQDLLSAHANNDGSWWIAGTELRIAGPLAT